MITGNWNEPEKEGALEYYKNRSHRNTRNFDLRGGLVP